jgi:hypothetical protein
MKKCPVCHRENPEWTVICMTKGCVHVFRADNPQPNVATIGRTYPAGSYENR